MDDLRDLYQTTILDHNRSPRNFGELPDADRCADGHNPLCGDRLTVCVRLSDDDRIEDVRFTGDGCAISKASASLMTEYVKGKRIDEARKAFDAFHELLTSSAGEPTSMPDLGKLAVFAGVREFPVRVKCATLCWHTLNAALEGRGETVKTE